MLEVIPNYFCKSFVHHQTTHSPIVRVFQDGLSSSRAPTNYGYEPAYLPEDTSSHTDDSK